MYYNEYYIQCYQYYYSSDIGHNDSMSDNNDFFFELHFNFISGFLQFVDYKATLLFYDSLSNTNTASAVIAATLLLDKSPMKLKVTKTTVSGP